MDISAERWNGNLADQAFEGFGKARRPVIRATRRLLEDFYREHFRGNETVLEIGAGQGFLYRNWPKQYSGKWIQLDREEHLLYHAIGETHIGTAYALPFPDKSMDVVCGYGSFDVLFDLESAVSEMARVIKDDGRVFHFLDLEPNTESILFHLEKTGRIAYPDDLGLVFAIDDGKEAAYKHAIEENKQLERFSDGWKNYREIRKPYGDYLDQGAYFRNRAIRAFSSHFPYVESGFKSAHFIGQKEPHHPADARDSEFGLLSGSIRSCLLGTPFGKLSENLPANHCVEVSQMDYMLARNLRIL